MRERMALLLGVGVVLCAVGELHAASHELLLSKPSDEQDRILAMIIHSAGFACPKVARKMFVGTDENQAGYFSVACSDGQEWMVRVLNGAKGQTSTMPCTAVEILKVKCWQKM